MDFKIRYIKKNELQKLLRFNRRNYHVSHILTNKKYLDWQFGSLPRTLSHYTILGIFNKKDDLLGVLGLTFLDYLYFGKRVRCTSFANLMVEERLRNLGLGYVLMREAEKKHHISLDHGVNRDAMRLFLGRGWVGGDLHRYGFVFNNKNIKKIIKKGNPGIRDSVRRSVVPFGEEFISLQQYDRRLGQFFKKAEEKYSITVDRSKAYLNWRYFKHPLIKYHVFVALENKAFTSFMVVRIDGPTHFRVGRIIDFMSLDSAEKFSLAEVLDFCAEKKVNFVDYYFSGSTHIKSLQSLGFIDCSQEPYSLLPKSLNPITLTSTTNINFVAITNSPEYKKVKYIKNWYTTKGGGDQDRAY